MDTYRGRHRIISHSRRLTTETKEEIKECHQELDKVVSDNALLDKCQKEFNKSSSEMLLLASRINAITGIWQVVSLPIVLSENLVLTYNVDKIRDAAVRRAA